MKTLSKRKTYFGLAMALCFIVVLLYVAFDVRAINSTMPLTRAFSDPSKQVEMPEEWIKQPIKYEQWAENADLAVSLDQHMYPALLSFIEKYARENGLNIAVNEGTCGISAGLLKHKAADVTGFCCPPGEIDRLPDVQFHTVGIGALALLVQHNHPVDNITFDQAQKIFQGKILRWSELKTSDGNKGPDMPIHPVIRLHCKKRPGHWCLLLRNEDLFSPRVREVGSIEDVMVQVFQKVGAIGGAETMYMARYRYPQKRGLKPVKIDGNGPDDAEALISGKYPFYFTYSVTTWERKDLKNPHVQKFVDYLIQQAENIDSKFGIIPASRLRSAGWKFKVNELVGEPPE